MLDFNSSLLVVIAICVLLVAAHQFIPDLFGHLMRRRSAANRFPVHMNSRITERITEASNRLTQARAVLVASQTALRTAESAANVNPRIPARDAELQVAQQHAERAQEVVQFEELQFAQLLQTQESDVINWGVVVQYVVFGTLAWFVLVKLLDGITTSPPAGSTPRSMITFLIAVVTVGIALILVLATIVSNSDDREKRFSQGKEVLTALLGVLGTIVGFYFGSAQDELRGFVFDPIVITETPGKNTVSLRTYVHGGKSPYTHKTTFVPATISPLSGESMDGRIDVEIPKAATSYVITVRDIDGLIDSIANNQAAAEPAAGAKK